MKAWRFLPLGLFVLIVGAMVWRLAVPGDSTVPSKLVGRPIPAFALPPALPGKLGLASEDLSGSGAHLVNVFASWCVPCIAEAKVLRVLKDRGVRIEGIAIRDTSEEVGDFLERIGDPYDRIGADRTSQVQIALGSAGVPESYVVDSKGVIRLQHIGPIEEDDVPGILAAMEQAR